MWNTEKKVSSCLLQEESSDSKIICSVSYVNTYIWNLERCYWWTYFQGSNGDPDIENKLMDKGGGEEGEDKMNGVSSMEAYTLPYVK